MTKEILDRANAIQRDIKEMTEILEVLTADRLDISITSHVNGIARKHEWQGDGFIGIEFKKAMMRIIDEKLNRYIAEFEAL